MSTFGKKALCWWNYPINIRDESIRFNHTSPTLQLLILEKWYPIGMQVEWVSNEVWEIIGYQKKISSYDLILERCGGNNRGGGIKYNRFPLSLRPANGWDIKIKRDIKIDKILK